ncbi:uncharacterized protein [Coffea arabica]|uniref:Reverse transcriptase RNase H-like domain-containing protein n=1 Tax=Coffea arabica TaxID=13443 RepID=A0ABM4WPG7_COFAR
MRVDKQKVKVILEWPTPKYGGDVRSFHGLADFYRRFVKDFSILAAPLTELIKRNEKFHWGDPQEKAFQLLKHKLTHAPVLTLPDFSKTFEIDCDALGIRVGVVLTQEGKPVAYFSEKLNGAALKYSTYDKELYALIRALQVWQHYLKPKEFVIHTDHESFKYLKVQHNLSKKHARWIAFVESFPYVIKCKTGKSNMIADSLSHWYSLLTTLDARLLSFEMIKDLYAKNADFGEICASCAKSGQGVLLLATNATRCRKSDGSMPYLAVHSTTCFSPFEIVYGFNPLTPLDLVPLPSSERVNIDGKKRANFVKKLHEKVYANIEKCTTQYAKHANKGRHKMVFEPGEYGVSTTFNVSDLAAFDTDDACDLRTNPSQEEGNASIIMVVQGSDSGVEGPIASNQVRVPIGPITRARAKRFKEQLNALVQTAYKSFKGFLIIGDVDQDTSKLVNCIQVVDAQD